MDSCLGPFTRFLLNDLGSDSMVSGAEIDSITSLFGSRQFGDPKHEPCHKMEAVWDIPTVLAFQRGNIVSLKEQCALSHLRSNCRELKDRGLCMLLDLLLGLEEDTVKLTDSLLKRMSKSNFFGSSHSNPESSRYGAYQEGIESKIREQLKKQSNMVKEVSYGSLNTKRDMKLSGGITSRMGTGGNFSLKLSRTGDIVVSLRQRGTAEAGMHRFGSQTERALKEVERNWCKFEQVKCPSESGLLRKDFSQHEHGVEPVQIMDWLKSGFLEAVMKRTTVEFDGQQKKVDRLKSGRYLNVEVVAKACLRVLDIVPKEGSSRVAKFLVLSLKEMSEEFMKLNLDPNENGSNKLHIQWRSHDKGTKGNPMTPGKIMQASAKHQTTKVQQMLEKVLKFCELLSLLTSNSSLVGGPFGESGGLDLVLDLYSCLVKRFPINLGLGALSSAVGASHSLEQILPGGVVKRQDTPLKVLPCILPSACICRVAQACLLDHSMPPLKENTDFIWPTGAAHEKALCPTKQVLCDSYFNLDGRRNDDELCNSPLKVHFKSTSDLVPEVPKEAELNKSQQSTSTVIPPEDTCSPQQLAPTVFSSPEISPFPLGTEPSSISIDSSRDMGSHVGSTSSSPLLKQTRPFVPRLPLNSLKSPTPRFEASREESQESRVLHISAMGPATSEVPCVNEASTAEFEIFTAVCNVKFELLQTMGSLFSNHSRSLYILKSNFLQKIQKEEEDQLVLRFLPDIIGGFLNIIPESKSRRMKIMLFRFISLLEKSKNPDGMSKDQSSGGSGNEEKWYGLHGGGPSLKILSEPKRFLDIFLLEIGERLRILVCHLTQMLATSQHLQEEGPSNSQRTYLTSGALRTCSPLMENHTFSSGHLLSLWVDVGLLLRALGDFVLLWPEEVSVQCVLNSCGRQVESVISLLAMYFGKRNWSLAQILTMQHLLKLFIVCMKSFDLEKSPESQNWGEIDAFFWQLLVMNDLHWNCVKSFTSWVVMESCHGCLRNLFEGYEKVLWEPLEIYYNMLGECVDGKSTVKNFSCSDHRVDICRRTIFSFLRITIMMIKKRLKCQSQSTQPCVNLCMGRISFLLEFLMNPLEGLLISVIQSPVHCIRLNRMPRETKAMKVLNSTNLSNSTGEDHVTANPGPTLPANPEIQCSNQVHMQCRNCLTSSCGPSFAEKFISYVKQESLCILADIFALKGLEHNDEHPNFCLNPRVKNPFLFMKYVTPFLEIVFFCFLKSYNKNVESSEPRLISPFARPISTNTGEKINECTLTDDRYSCYELPLSRNDKDEVFCSIHSGDDEISSIACITYGQVLLALAQNQTEDVSKSFQQMRVMDFLVHQIGLEYEVSQVVTPRDNEIVVVMTKTPFIVQERKGSDCRDFEATVNKPSIFWSGEKVKVQNFGDKVKELKAGAQENTTDGDTVNKSVFLTTGNLMESSGLNWLSPGRVASFQDSSEQKSLKSHELKLGSSLQNLDYHSGLHLGRDCHSDSCTKILLDGNSPKQCAPNSRNVMYPGQKRIIPSKTGERLPVPFRQRDDNTILEKQSLSERGTLCTRTSFQNRNGAVVMSNRSSKEKDENDIRLPTIGGQFHGLQAESVDNHVKKSCSASKFGIIADFQGPQLALQDEKTHGMNILSTSSTLRYTGRFFDLNEEVDRELGEEFQDSRHRSSQVGGLIAVTKQLKMIHKIHEGGDRHGACSKLLSVNLIKPKTGPSHQSSDSDSSSEFGSRTVPRQTLARPVIPRLNLSKSLRKGGPAINSNTSIHTELFPATTATIESKGRLSSLLQLQKELNKELVNSDRDNKSLGIGVRYETERLQRRIYRHAGLHVLLLELFVSLMLTSQGTLETFYSDRYPMENLKLNAPFFLSYHLNHVSNAYLLPSLSKRMKDFKPAAFRILKLTCRALFNPRIYTNRVRIARGALSQVFTAKVGRCSKEPEGPIEERVVLKIVDLPKGPHDPCKFFDVYSEVEILEKFLGDPAVCQILDYGVDTESFILVLKHYKCSLHTWRQGYNGNSSSEAFSPTGIQNPGVAEKFALDRLPLYLEVYSAVLQAVKALEIENVVHYDLKCNNILLEPVDPLCSEAEFWTPI